MKLLINGEELKLNKFIDVESKVGKTILTHRPCDSEIELEFVKEKEEEFVKVFPHYSLINKKVSLLGGSIVLHESGVAQLMLDNCGHKPFRVSPEEVLFTIEVGEVKEEKEEKPKENKGPGKSKGKGKITPPPVRK